MIRQYEIMETSNKRVICIALIVFLLLCMAAPVDAASKATNAKKAYNKLLVSGNDNWVGWEDSADNRFALIDMDKNGVPELVVTGDSMYHSYFYTYKKGKIKQFGCGFSGNVKFYPNKKLVMSRTIHDGTDMTYYYKFNGKGFVEKARKHGCDYMNLITGEEKTTYDSYEPYVYYKNGQSVDQNAYKSYVKKLKENAKEKKLKLHKATKKNYKKYLK